jgi:hypothetical protein
MGTLNRASHKNGEERDVSRAIGTTKNNSLRR